MIHERNRQDIIGNIGLSFEDIKNSKKIYFKYILFLLIISMTIVPSLAISIHDNQNETVNNSKCSDCHTTHQMVNIPSESSKISKANTSPVSKPSGIQSFATSNVAGNITLISSLGQNWYQQGIYGPNSSNDSSWGWTFFDENPSSGFITPSENVTQRQNIYALLLDDGNNSNPISGAIVVANVTYWTWDNISYANHIVPVQLTEETNRKGFYSGRFDFYGGTSYSGDTMANCDGCHSSIYGTKDMQIGYFPGNYTVLIRAEADGKIIYSNLNFEVTPWGCEDCHGSGNRHRASADMDSACYICHGINTISGMSEAGNPHQNIAHQSIDCTQCHTNKTLSSQTFEGVTFAPGGINDNRPIPQYINNTIQLNGGTHSALACTYCHNDLSLPGPQGGYGSYAVSGNINSHDPSFAGLEQFEDYYVINVESSDPLNISFDWNSTANLGFYLYPPDFNPKNGIRPPYYDGADPTNKPEIYTNSAPMAGKWILQIYGYDLRYDFPGWNSWGGVLQPPINYTVNSTYPIQKKDLPSTPECNNCHNSGATGGANTKYEIPDWNPGFAHADTNGDGTLDIQCRMCHDSMHDIGIKTCQNCHTKAPTNHPITDPSFTQYTPGECLACHGDPHRVTLTGGTECIACHKSPTGDNIYAAIDTDSFGKHKNINTTDGNDNVTDSDCESCHYNISNMMNRTLNVDTRICTDCHLEGNFSAPVIRNHKPPKMPVSMGGNISTTAYCSICHNNSINKYIYSVNASVSHYVTNESLVKTVNQTSKPGFGFMNSGDAQQYNKECNNCHTPSNSSYGNATNITMPHIGRATCDECHVNGSASDLHNVSLGMPVTFNCLSCHTTYASKYGAANIAGTPMAGYSTCGGGNCHGNDISDSLDTRAKHNVDRTFAGTGGSTDTVYLNNQVSLTVTKGAIVNITSRVNDALKYGGASRIGGAEYYIGTDPGQGKGTSMAAVDGNYDALQNSWENVAATIDTSSLSGGTYVIYVRGMDIGKQWSAPKNATLIVQAFGYINGTVTNGTAVPVSDVYVSTTGANYTTGSDGNYSLRVLAGTYTVNASKLPEYYDYTAAGIIVTPLNTTTVDIMMDQKPTGTISGVVKIT